MPFQLVTPGVNGSLPGGTSRSFDENRWKRIEAVLARFRVQENEMATHLTLDQMKEFVRNHFEDFVNQRNPAAIRQNMTPDFYDHDGPGGQPAGVEGDEKMMLAMYQSMPDLRIEIEDMIAEGDKVVCRNIWRWSDPVSGKKMQFHGFVWWRFEGGKIAERWATVTPPAEGMAWTAAAAKE